MAHTVVPDDDGVVQNTTEAIIARAETTPDAAQWAETTAARLRPAPSPGKGTAHTFISDDGTRGLL